MQIQNIVDKKGVLRFEENLLVTALVDNFTYEGYTGLNALAIYWQVNNLDAKYYEQITQLIGYSVSGFANLATTTDATWEKVQELIEDLPNENN